MTISKYGNLERFPSVKGGKHAAGLSSQTDSEAHADQDECVALQIPLFPADDVLQMRCTAVKPCSSIACTLCHPSWKKD